MIFIQRLFTCLFAMFGFYLASAETITLASKGVPRYQIVSSASASPTEKFAIDELKKYLCQISKANFELSDKLSDHSIIVGSLDLIQKIAPNIKLPSIGEEEYGIFKRGKNLCLIGGSNGIVLYVVYDFLAQLGCRWIAPDFEFYEGTAQRIPVQKDLSYHHISETVRKPALKYRKLYIEEGLSHNTQNLLKLIDWMPKARFNILVSPLDYEGGGRVKWENWREQLTPELKKRGIIIEVGGHGYQNFLNAKMEDGQLYKVHPDWFGLDKNGKRSSNPHVVFCTSNPGAVTYLQNNLLNYLQTHPEIDIFDFWPPDSETWCECPKCKALGTATDRHALLVSQTAQFLSLKYPNLKLECLAYSRYTEPPQHKILDKSVLLDFCPINQSFEYQIYQDSSANNKAYKENLLSWLKIFGGDVSIYSYYRKYAWRSLPNVIPHYMQNDLQFYRDCGVKGISVYAEPGDWFTYGLNHYVLGHLACDPNIGVDSLITDYCTTLYGPVADVAISVYRELENIVRYGCKIPHTKPKSAEQYKAYKKRLEVCSNKVKTATGKYASDQVLCHHLQRLELMVEYATQSVALMQLTIEGNNEEANKVANDIKRLMNENSATGIFIPH